MTRYFRYELMNIEPLCITDKAGSQSGQTATLQYIPGTTIRGFIINAIAEEDDFEKKKKILFSDKVRYLNAYRMENGEELLPSPKGFYETKNFDEDKKEYNEDKKFIDGDKEIKNVVVSGECPSGYKRAAIGRYCYMDSKCLYYYSMKTGSDIKIQMNPLGKEKQNIFRNEYMAKGHTFVGYIAVDEPSIEEILSNTIRGTIVLGNARTAGHGKCIIKSTSFVDSIPYDKYIPKCAQKHEAYMMLLSPMTMRDGKGEYCGIDIMQLEKKLGVKNLTIPFCSTSTVEIKGYNRTWRTKVPSVPMYEQGSVFHLYFDGVLKREKISQICHEGIGVRKNEGFGRVLFLNNYEKIECKRAGKESSCPQNTVKRYPEDEKVLKLVATYYYRQCIDKAIQRYVLEHPINKGDITNSQLGNILSLASAYQYDPQNGRKEILEYFKHAREKEEKNKTQREYNSIKIFQEKIESILSAKDSLEKILGMEQNKKTVMGISKNDLISKKEKDYFRLKLISELIRYDKVTGKT